MRKTYFTTFISIAFAMVVGSAWAGDDPATEPTEQQHSAPQSRTLDQLIHAARLKALREFGCAPDDRKCEVRIKMRGLVGDDIERLRKKIRGF